MARDAITLADVARASGRDPMRAVRRGASGYNVGWLIAKHSADMRPARASDHPRRLPGGAGVLDLIGVTCVTNVTTGAH